LVLLEEYRIALIPETNRAPLGDGDHHNHHLHAAADGSAKSRLRGNKLADCRCIKK
jgi:hypothetical protein